MVTGFLGTKAPPIYLRVLTTAIRLLIRQMPNDAPNPKPPPRMAPRLYNIQPPYSGPRVPIRFSSSQKRQNRPSSAVD